MASDMPKEPSLADQAFKTLKSLILRGELLPGTRLRIEVLQKTYGLSSSPLREALNRLISERLVQIDSHRGFWVASVSVSELMELTDMRKLVESEALRRSVATGDDGWEGEIIAAFHRLSKAEDRHGDMPHLALNDDWSIRHREFHMALLAGCGSKRLLEECGALFDEAERYRRLSARMRERPRQKSTEHENLMEAALSRDADRAVALLRAHIQQTATNVAPALDGLAAAAQVELLAKKADAPRKREAAQKQATA